MNWLLMLCFCAVSLPSELVAPRLVLNRAGDQAAVRVGDKLISVFSIPDQQRLADVRPSFRVTCHAFSQDGSHLLVGGADGQLSLVNVENRRIIASTKLGHSVASVASGPKHWLAGSGRKLTRFDSNTLKVLGSIELVHPIASIATSPDGKSVAVSARRLELYSIESLTLKKSFGTLGDKGLGQVIFSPRGDRIAVAGFLHHAKVCVVATGRQRKLPNASVHGGPFLPLSFSADGRELFVGRDHWDLLLVRRWHRGKHPSGEMICKPDHRYFVSIKDDRIAVTPRVPTANRNDSNRHMRWRWMHLTDPDPQLAYHLVRSFVDGGGKSIEFLKLQIGSSVEKRIQQLVRDLDNPDNWISASAAQELVEFAARYPNVFEKMINGSESATYRKRLTGFCEEARLRRGEAQLAIREIRVVQILEQIGSAAAIDLLKQIRNRSTSTHQQRDAKTAIEMMTVRSKKGNEQLKPLSSQEIPVVQEIDLTGVPQTTRPEDLPDLFEERPPGSGSFHMRKNVVSLKGRRDDRVYYLPTQKQFYVQRDRLGSSQQTFYGPIKGDPRKKRNQR